MFKFPKSAKYGIQRIMNVNRFFYSFFHFFLIFRDSFLQFIHLTLRFQVRIFTSVDHLKFYKLILGDMSTVRSIIFNSILFEDVISQARTV